MAAGHWWNSNRRFHPVKIVSLIQRQTVGSLEIHNLNGNYSIFSRGFFEAFVMERLVVCVAWLPNCEAFLLSFLKTLLLHGLVNFWFTLVVKSNDILGVRKVWKGA